MEKLDKRTPDLWQALIDAGLCQSNNPYSARGLIYRWIKQGLFVYPKNRPVRTEYMYSQKMIDDIVKAFSPNGKGRWSIEDYD